MKDLETLLKRKEEIEFAIREHNRFYNQKGKTSYFSTEEREESDRLRREYKNVIININQVKFKMFGKKDVK